MKTKFTVKSLLDQNPCPEGKMFLKKSKTLKRAWRNCNNPQWMIWALNAFKLFPEDKAREFAVACADHTLHFFEDDYPNDKRPRQAIEYARSLIDNPSPAWSAARNAAWSAARNAAWSASRNAGWSAEASASRSAAESAAWSAAASAAWSAAWSAAESAARNAAWSAARNAALNAAESAGWSAEENWQADKLREIIDPFKNL